MSWSLNCTPDGPLPAPEVFRAIKLADLPDHEYGGQAEFIKADILPAAKDAAIRLIESGGLGGSGHMFNVSFSGHANPGHEPVEGWSNDFVGIQISQANAVTE